jgi:hypothetical protein
MKVQHCDTCGGYVKPDCDWQQGRCPHQPPLIKLDRFIKYLKRLFRG